MIEVGEYVRSLINGNIFKVIEVSDLLNELGVKYYKFDEFRGMCSTEEYNTKHSKNVIDLIEEGDYVNGHLVVDKKSDENRTELGIESDHIIYHYVDDEKIKSILTKEQYEANCYKVEEE